MKKSDADLAERLSAHYEIHQKHHPVEILTPEFDTLILYFLEKNDGVDDQDRVFSDDDCILRIRPSKSRKVSFPTDTFLALWYDKQLIVFERG